MPTDPPPRGRRRLTPALLGLTLLVPSPGVPGEVVERVVAAVDKRPILLSEVRAVQAVRGFSWEEALKATVDETLMFREASRLVAAASAGLAQEEAYRALLAAHPALLGPVTEAELRRFLHRQAVILKYIDLRFRPQVRIADEVVKEAYESEYAGRATAPDFAVVADEVKEQLVRRDLDARIEGWVKELREGAEIRYNPGEGGGR